MKFKVLITRDCSFTQSAEAEIEADDKDDALQKATYDTDQDGLRWLDDDDSYHFGEDGVYVADPATIEETK